MLSKLQRELRENANTTQAQILQRFFKTGKGQYGEGDVFLGIKVPVQRSISKKYFDLNLGDLQKLLNSKVHEERLCSLFILIDKYKKANDGEKKKIFDFYLKNSENVNNWDLVDLSAPSIIGDFLLDKNKNILYKLAKSENLWKRRIAIISTFAFIRNNEFKDALKIAEFLLNDTHDLIHKAVGWMLREIGKKNKNVLENFLIRNYKMMPRTMLRYAIEKFNDEERRGWLRKD